MDISSFFSIIFCGASAVFLSIGIYAFYLDSRNRTNILFFNLTLALGIWAFGFSMSIAAESLGTVLFWRRFAAIGFGCFFAALLRFTLAFTGGGMTGWRKWFIALLYLPTVIVILGFTYFPSLNPGQYNMVLTQLGWVNVAVNNAWDWFYTAYYVLYSAASLYLFWRWGRESTNPMDKKRSALIIISFLCTMLIGSLTDILGNVIFDVAVPQLAPLLMLFPAIVIYYLIKKHGFLNSRHVDMEANLMSDQIRTKITNYISNTCLFAALLNIVANYLLTENADITRVLIFSVVLILIGVMFQAIQRSVKQNQMKDILNAAVFSLIVPLLIFQHIDTAGTTLWAFPMILLIVTLIYGKEFLQIILFAAILLTQAVVWLIKPEVTITIDSADYVVRIGIFLIAIWFALFAKRIFRSKLQENAEQIRSQKIITEISTEFITVNEQSLDGKVNATLLKLGAFLDTARAYIYLFDNNKEKMTCQYIWHNEKSAAEDIEKDITTDSFPLFTASIISGNPISLSDISGMSTKLNAELPRLLGSFNKSFAAMPVIINDEVIGFLGIDSNRKTKEWSETQLSFLQIVTNILADTYERTRQDKAITEMAYFDYLTKLPNRILFKDRVAQAINLTERTGKTLAVVFLDLDAFKAVNDTLGHDGGDALIIQTAGMLKNNLRKSDAIARFGGDEFLILLNNLNSPKDIHGIIEKILAAFDEALIVDEQEFYVSASAGIAVYPYDGADPEMLVKNADIAMYKAKESGKNRYMFCTEDMKEEILKKVKLSGNLFQALERHELQLYYQPQVCTHSKEIIGTEALLRWLHPEFGLIPPGVFIPLAEQTGLIGPIGDWVLMTACLQCKTWHLKGLRNIRIAVNVSVLQLRNPGFVYRVGQILDETQLEPKYLELEITESVMVSESEYIIEVLKNLQNLGVSISIDDFGTEYSSLSRLTAMPINRIKLDMQFVHDIGRGEKENAIIQGIIGLAHNLGLRVTAEGVETEQQLEFLTERSSDEIQGFYFYRPVPAEEMEEILRRSE